MIRGIRLDEDMLRVTAAEPPILPEDREVERHYGPGQHPGTGTDQEVHGGNGGGDRPIDRYLARVKDSDILFETGHFTRELDQQFDSLSEAVHAMMENEDIRDIEITDPERGIWASFMVGDDVPVDEVDWDQEFQMFLEAHDHMVERLSDPQFIAIAKEIDRGGDSMAAGVREYLERLNAARERGEQVDIQQDAFGYNIKVTNNPDNVGVGSASVGLLGAKVFWQPLSMPEEDQAIQQGGMHFGLSPSYVQIHEMHHAFGSPSEFDMFSDVVATDFYIDNYDRLPGYLQLAVQQEVADGYNFATQRAAGELKDHVTERRITTGYLWSQHSDFIEAQMETSKRYYEEDDQPYAPWYDDIDDSRRRMNRWSRDLPEPVRDE